MYILYFFVHTFNEVKYMHRKLKKSVVYVLYGLAFIFMLGGLFYIDSTNDKEAISIIPDNKYVSKDIIDEVDDLPVNASDNKKEIINTIGIILQPSYLILLLY